MATDDGTDQFGRLLRQRRLAAALSQEELAERAALSRRGIADLERGARRSPHPATVRRLSEALRLSAEDRAQLLGAARRTEITSGAPNLLSLSSLPVKLTSFVGRERELDGLRQRIEVARLVTLVGPGGIGKTRLALEMVARQGENYPDGIFLVDLAALSKAELVVSAVAGALGLRVELDRQPDESILRFLAARQLLLVLDNCEHLVQACAELVAALLQRCPGVTILATSRELLGVEGEVLWRLEPLAESAALQLFIDRARAQLGEFEPGDGAVVRHVCRALDHLPLAIELAAARVGVLTPAEILSHLQDRFALLTRVGVRGASPRQQTLRATLDWSYELLEPAEAQLFRRLAVFVGPFDMSAANTMGGPQTLDLLARLVDKSFVLATPTDRGSRYRLLDTLQRYGLDRLHEVGDVQLARQRHLDHFLARAETLYTPTESIDGATRALDDDFDNLRAALEWCQTANPQAGLRLIGCTRSVWFRHDFAEGRRWAYLFLERCPEPSVARSRALLTAALLEGFGGAGSQQARELLVQARELGGNLGDRSAYLMADFLLGTVAYLDGRIVEAARQLEGSLRVSEELGDESVRARILMFQGLVGLTDRGRREDARKTLEPAQQLNLKVGDGYTAGLIDYAFGLYWRWTGHARRALPYFRRSVSALHAIGEVANLSIALLHIARLVAGSEPSRAARLAGAALAIGTRAGTIHGARIRQAADQLQSELEARLGAQQTQREWTQGERLSVDEAVSLALQDEASTTAQDNVLSARELEVAQLVAQGLTSAQIASLLHLSPRTVDNHLARIFNKLGLSSRLQLATWLVAGDTRATTAHV